MTKEERDKRIEKQNRFIASLLLNIFLSLVTTILTLIAAGVITLPAGK